MGLFAFFRKDTNALINDGFKSIVGVFDQMKSRLNSLVNVCSSEADEIESDIDRLTARCADILAPADQAGVVLKNINSLLGVSESDQNGTN